MAVRNPQTWTRLQRVKLRQLANAVGNLAMESMAKWPSTGEGRAVKASTERITRLLDGQQPTRDIHRAFAVLNEAADEFVKLLDNSFFQQHIAVSQIRQPHSESQFVFRLVNEATEETFSYIAANSVRLRAETDAEHLGHIVPDQKVGPARFEIQSGVVRLQHQAAIVGLGDERNANAARDAILIAGAELATELKSSNADRRLIGVVRDIRDRIEAKQDIIQLGLAAISCQLVCEGFAEELPIVIGSRLRAYSVSVGMYVAQFPEWVRFSDNAAMADFSAQDVRSLYSSGVELVSQLRQVGPAVDPEVPRTIAYLLETINDPRRAAKRTVFASVRTMENLISIVFQSFGGLLVAIPEGAKAGVKSAAKTVTYSALLLVTAEAAVHISPAAGRILQTNWLHDAGKLILDNLKKVEG